MSRRFDIGYGSNESKGVKLITSPIWHYGIVKNINDPLKAGRIQVRIIGSSADGLDNDTPEDIETNLPENGGLPWCEPLLPKFINAIPKVGELVKIVTFDYRNKRVNRQYIGPVIPQQIPPDLLNSDNTESQLKITNGLITPERGGNWSPNWENNSRSSQGVWKIYPDINDIAILGRRNTDIILKNNGNYDEIILRVGKIDSNSLKKTPLNGEPPYSLNIKNPGYITVNFTEKEAFTNTLNLDTQKLNLTTDRSHINLVATKINLISHEGSKKRGLVNPIIKGTDIKLQQEIEDNLLHPLPYGDVLWEFIILLGNYIFNHIHEGSRLPPDKDKTKDDLLKWYTDNIGVSLNTVNRETIGLSTKNINLDNCKFLSKGVKTN